MPAPPSSSQPDTHRSPAPRPPSHAEGPGVPEHGYGYGGGPAEPGSETYSENFGELRAGDEARHSVNRQTAPERAVSASQDRQVHYTNELVEPAGEAPPPHRLSPTEEGDHDQKARGFDLARDLAAELMVGSVLLAIVGLVLAAFLQVFLAIPVLLVAAGLFFASKRATKRAAEKAREHHRWLNEDQP